MLASPLLFPTHLFPLPPRSFSASQKRSESEATSHARVPCRWSFKSHTGWRTAARTIQAVACPSGRSAVA